jgi:hypothetical protein
VFYYFLYFLSCILETFGLGIIFFQITVSLWFLLFWYNIKISDLVEKLRKTSHSQKTLSQLRAMDNNISPRTAHKSLVHS